MRCSAGYVLALAFVLAGVGTRTQAAVPIAAKISGELQFDQRQDGRLDSYNPRDLFSVTVPGNGRLSLDLAGTPATAGSLELFDVNGVLSLPYQVAHVSLSGSGRHTLDAWLKAGTYYVRVSRSRDAWPYQLTPSFTAARYARDTEPNHTFQQAQQMPLEGTVSGHIGYFSHGFTDTRDWWAITTPASGHLSIALRGTERTNGFLDLYDVNGITRIERSDLRDGRGNVRCFLAPGTYYVLVERNDHAWEYVLESSFVSAPLHDSAKPNDTWHAAAPLVPGEPARGHLRYYRRGLWYADDWYRITTNEEGALEVALTVSAEPGGARGRLRLHSPDWTQEKSATFDIDALPSGEKQEQITVTSGNFPPGAYHVRVERNAGDFAYELSSRSIPGDVEESGFDAAVPIELDGSATELEGSATGVIHDGNRTDWYQVTVPANGRLQFVLISAVHTLAYLNLYDVNGRTRLEREPIWDARAAIVSHDLAPGTYFVLIEYHGRAFSYTLNGLFTAAVWDADTEPNDHFTQATSLPLNSTTTGHIGYRSNSQMDRADWYAIETVEFGVLTVQMETDAETQAGLTLYDVDAHSWLQRELLSTNAQITHHLPPGTYFVQVEERGRPFSYRLTNRFSPAMWDADPEPNGHFTAAAEIQLTAVVTGHVGYQTGNCVDPADWYKVTIPQNGKLELELETQEAARVRLSLYDVNGVTRLEHHGLLEEARTGSVARHLAPGTYHILVASDQLAHYRLTSAFTPASLPGDPEYNDFPAAAVPLPVNTQTTGHLGYYSDGWRDEADFYRVDLPTGGQLTVNLAADGALFTRLGIRDAAGHSLSGTMLREAHSGSVTAESVMPGTYYIGVESGDHRILSYVLNTTFTAAGDGSAPRVISTFPASGAIVSTRNIVHASFSRKMDPDSIEDGIFHLVDRHTDRVPGALRYTGTMLTFMPAYPLEVGETYTATIVPARDTGSRALVDAPYSWSFTVGTSDVDLEDPSTGVTGTIAIQPDGVHLAPNHPNPFNSTTRIRFALPAAAPVQLEIFSITGQRMAVLVNDTQPAGWHTVSFDAADLASGVYIARLRAGRQVHTRTMLLLK